MVWYGHSNGGVIFLNWLESHWDSTRLYIWTLFKWLVVGCCIGVFGGFVGSLFHISVDECTHIREMYPAIMYLLPAAGLVIVYVYRTTSVEGRGTNTIIESIQSGVNVPVSLVPAIFIGTVLTHFCGGSAGREGAALQLGGGIGCHVGRMFQLDEKDMRIATLCGMSALFSALFGTPVTAAFFAMEVVSVGIVYYSAFVPCMVSSIPQLINMCKTGF